MKITWTNVKRKLGQLKPWKDNPRVIGETQNARLTDSFNSFSQVEPFAISPDGDIYDGHQRWNNLIAKYGKDYSVDCRMSSRKLTEKERRKLVIYLHAGATGDWSWDVISGWDAKELIGWGFDKSLEKAWRTDIAALDNLIKSEEVEPGDAEPEISGGQALKRWKVKENDLFILGRHKLLCADSTVRANIERLTDKNPYCVLTDPPYNVGFDYNDLDDNKEAKEYASFCRAWFEVVKDAGCLIFSPGPKNTRLYPEPRDYGFWLKRYASAGASAFNLRCIEPIMIYGKIGKKRNFDLFDYSSGFTDELRAAQRAALVEEKHPPAKPIGLWLDLMSMLPDLPVLDCFSGNGTTFMAAEQSGRTCYGIERDPSYCALILQRMQDAFGIMGVKVK